MADILKDYVRMVIAKHEERDKAFDRLIRETEKEGLRMVVGDPYSGLRDYHTQEVLIPLDSIDLEAVEETFFARWGNWCHVDVLADDAWYEVDESYNIPDGRVFQTMFDVAQTIADELFDDHKEELLAWLENDDVHKWEVASE